MRTSVQWFTALIQAGLETRFLTERDVLAHATPSVLIGALPKDVLAGVFDSALGSGKMTPETILATITTETLVEHAPPSVLWACLASAAERKGLAMAATGVGDVEMITEMLRRGLAAGLSLGVISAADVVRQVTPKILVAQFPDALSVKLFEASLSAGVMNPGLFVETLGDEALAKYAPVQVWACLAGAGYAIATASATGERDVPPPPPAKKPAAELVDEVVSMIIDLEESIKPGILEPPVVEAKPPTPPTAAAKPRPRDQAKS